MQSSNKQEKYDVHNRPLISDSHDSDVVQRLDMDPMAEQDEIEMTSVLSGHQLYRGSSENQTIVLEISG